MALASQTIRTEVKRGPKNSSQGPRRKKKQRTALAVAGAIVVLAGGYVAYRQFGTRPAPQTQNQAANTPESPDKGKTPATTNIPVPIENKPAPAPEPAPDVLTMGARGATGPDQGATPPAPAIPVVDPLTKPLDPSSPTTTPTTITPPPAAPAASEGLPAESAAAIDRAKRAMSENKLIEARGLLNTVLANPRVKESEKEGVRSWLGEINQTLVFSPTVTAGDALSETYKVVSGDSLEKIAKTRGLAIDKHLIARVNRMPNPDVLRIGQSLKLVHGPFHAVVHKSAFRIDLYAGTPLPPGTAGTPRTDGSEEGWTFIRSFQVGLGEDGGTPLGTFVVKKNSKLMNPHWVNPRTGEKFDKNDPKNPIGEHWLGLTGVDDKTRDVKGYGLHGTIDPSSIGKEKSMGCVRMAADDIAIVWEMLMDEVSTVRIVP